MTMPIHWSPETAAVVAALVGAFIGGLFAGPYQHARDYFNRPKLKLDFPEKDGGRVVGDRKDKKTGVEIIEHYVRVRVRNLGKCTAKNTRVYLASLHEIHRAGQSTPTIVHDAAQLCWAGWNFQPRDVPPGVTFFVDLVAVSTSESGWNFSLEHMFASHRSLWGFKGTLRFEIVVTADNAEFTSCFVDIEYRQDWHTLSAAEYFPN
jgi:hypothetical protein